MGYSYLFLKQIDKAEKLLEQSYKTYAEKLGENFINTARVSSILGLVKGLKGDNKQSHEYLQKAYEVQRETYGPDHSDTAIVLQYMGIVRAMEGDTSLARDLLENAYK